MRQYLLLSSVLLILSACGGNSSSSTNTGADKNATVQLKGVAVDDLIVNGVVKVYSATTPKKLLAEGRTDSVTGAYLLNVSYDGVVIIDVTADEQTLMKNPETGKTEKPEDDLNLQSAATVSEEVKEVEVNVSPLTDLVVTQMEARAELSGGEITQAHLEDSQENVGEIFGFDPLGDSPVEDENYKKTVSAIRQLADDKGVTLVEVIEELNADIVDGKAGDDGDIAKELATAMEEEGVKNTFTDNSGEVVDTKNPLDTTATPSPSPVATAVPSAIPSSLPSSLPEPEPTPMPTVADDIKASKAFFKNLRTETMSVVDYDDTGKAGFLDTESEALGDELDNMVLDIDLVANYSVTIVDLITTAVDENLTTKNKVIDDDENEDENSNSQKMMQKTANAPLTRSVVVTRTDDTKVWNYTIEDNTSKTYAGVVTLPVADVSTITASNFTELSATFKGKLPLRDTESNETEGTQDVTFELEVKKSPSGADIELKDLTIKNGTDLISVKTLKASVDYDHNSETDETTLKTIKLDTLTLKATLPTYEYNGKLDVSNYVTNHTISANGFEGETTEYKTHIDGNLICAGEHNEYLTQKNRGGKVIYTDKSSVEHTFTTHGYGDFYAKIEGNVHNLADGERIEENVWNRDDSNYSNYLGLNLDTVSLSSESCENMILDNFRIESFKSNFDGNDINRTYSRVSLFCVEANGTKSEPINVEAVFTDSLGVEHTMTANGVTTITYSDRPDEHIYWSTNYSVSYDGNSEGIPFDAGHEYFENFDRVAISNVNSECSNPTLDSVHIDFSPREQNGEEKNITSLYGRIKCADNSKPTEATVVYTDKAGIAHNLIYDSEHQYFYSDYHWDKLIEGNVEELEINRGSIHYRAIGKVLTPSFFKIEDSSCPNPKLGRYSIRLDSNNEHSVYNSGLLPKNLKFVGNIKNIKTSGFVDAELNVEWKNAEDMNLTEGSDDEKELKISLKGTVKMPDRPEMIVNLGFENSSEKNNYSLSYQHKTTVLNGKASFDSEDENGTIEFTGTNGIKLMVKQENGEVLYGADSPVTRNGRKIGELQEREDAPVIKYTDGSFESLL